MLAGTVPEIEKLLELLHHAGLYLIVFLKLTVPCFGSLSFKNESILRIYYIHQIKYISSM